MYSASAAESVFFVLLEDEVLLPPSVLVSPLAYAAGEENATVIMQSPQQTAEISLRFTFLFFIFYLRKSGFGVKSYFKVPADKGNAAEYADNRTAAQKSEEQIV